MALEANAALLTHDHAGITGGTARLLQMNTHQSPDTDSSTSSIHHSLGSGATQAAQGNHGHQALPELITGTFGASNRTVAPTVSVYYTGAPAIINGDIFAAGGWTTGIGENVDTDGMFQMSSGFASIVVPITGRYHVEYHSAGVGGPSPSTVVNRVTIGRNVNSCVVSATAVYPINSAEVQLTATGQRRLVAGDRLFWANWSNNGFSLRNYYFQDTYVLVRYVGPF